MQELYIFFFTAISFLFERKYKNDDHNTDEAEIIWPIIDEDGYYQSYKDKNGNFVNFWHKNMPSFVQILDGWDLKGLIGTFGSSDDFEQELEENLPVQKPYWFNDCCNPDNEEIVVGKTGIRATWIGHSTVLAEIDGFVVLTDPIFR